VDPQVAEAIVATVRDYYDGWFEGDAQRMRHALHSDLVKRGIADPSRTIDTDTVTTMIEATEQGIGTRHAPERRSIDISINHVHVAIADVHVTGAVYVDYLQLVDVDGRWQILNALWAPADTSRLT
jgi:ketosteroid isomerase-like protein